MVINDVVAAGMMTMGVREPLETRERKREGESVREGERESASLCISAFSSSASVESNSMF